jgi:biotin carboxyl carrier protein
VTTVPQTPLSNQVQRIAGELSARLAQIAKDPPDLASYLRMHAECVAQALQPVGLAYEMAAGQSFQRAFSFNYESLALRNMPAQEAAFQRAVRKTAETGQPIFLDANTAPANAPHGLSAEDVPSPESLSLHNQTPYQQVFVAILLANAPVGVLHAWFAIGDAAAAHARVALLAHAAAEIEVYLRARRITDLTQDLSRVTTYARFLEDVAGEQDLDSVGWKLVNYAREAVGCDRVCLLADARYGHSASEQVAADRFELQACSGLRRPHPRSEHAEVLKSHASELLKLATTPAEGETPRAPTAKPDGEERPPGDANAGPKTAETRPRMRIIFTNRDPAKAATRPDAVNHYFEVIPMNWSTVLPLYDRDNRVCGTLLFEGQGNSEKVAPVFLQMRDLAVSGGRALSTALVWDRRRALRGARKIMGWRDALIGSSRRRLLLKYGVPAALGIALLATPFPYRVKGEATLRPVNVETVSALTAGRLMEVNVREGDHVKKGQVLCVLDSADLNLQLRQAVADRERFDTEAAQTQLLQPAKSKLARLSAEKTQILADKLQHDIDQTVIKAPFDGIVAGPQDFTQRKGQVIRMGETVAEIVDPTHWEVKVSVQEEDVPTLRQQVQANGSAGVSGDLVLNANPDHVYPLRLRDENAFAHRLDTGGGKYHFSAILPLPEAPGDPAQIAPGVEMKTGYTGRARFACGRRTLARMMFGDFVRFLKVNVL